MNPAVYVESSVYDTSHHKECGVSIISISDDETYRTAPRKVKSTYLTQPGKYPYHPINDSNTVFPDDNQTCCLTDTGDFPTEKYSPVVSFWFK